MFKYYTRGLGVCIYNFIGIVFFFLLSVLKKKERKSLVKLDLFLLLFLIVTFVLTLVFSIYVDIEGGVNGYFPGIFINDSERYLIETRMFTANPLETNELLGSYDGYKVTPKMGLPSLLANINVFGIHNEYFIYFEFILISFFLCVVNYFLLKKIAVLFQFDNSWLFALAFFIFICFPFEFYWKTRLLREVFVHSFFSGALMLLVLTFSLNRRYFAICVLYLLLIILFRPQIYFLFFLFSLLFYRSLTIREIVMLTFILSLAFGQTILASGMSIFSGFLAITDLTHIYFVFKFIEDKISALYLIAIFSTLGFARNKDSCISSFPSPVLFLFTSSVLFFIVVSQMSSLRFFYPVLLLSLFLLFFSFLSRKINNTYLI